MIKNNENKKRVLIIKEGQVFNNIIKKHFEQKEYEVEITTNGSDGIRRAIANKPNMVILDINLSENSGFIVRQKMQSNEALKDIPILMVSSQGQEVNVNGAMNFVMNQALPIPANVSQAYNKINKINKPTKTKYYN